MVKRPNVRAPKPDPVFEEHAADRQCEPESYPTNNFALTALVLCGVIVLIALAYVTGMVK
jgi:hypothetical protein